MTTEKINQLEITLTHQERQIQDLNEMVNAQWKELAILKNRLDMALGKLSALEASPGDSTRGMSVAEIASMEKPPHY